MNIFTYFIKSCVLFVLCFFFINLNVSAENNSQTNTNIEQQKCSVKNSIGSVKVWSKEKKAFIDFDNIKELKPGNTINTDSNSEVSFNFEPAIVIKIKENSSVNFEKFLIDRTKKSIRMLLRIQKGSFYIKTDPLLDYTALITINSLSSTIDINNAEADIEISKDTAKYIIYDGNAKIRPELSDVKSVVGAQTKAVVPPRSKEVYISSIAEEKKKAGRIKETKIAILSIQSSTVARDNLDRVSDFIAENMEKQSNFKVLYLEDIRAMLKAEGQESLLLCYTDSCISKIGSIAGVDAVMIGGLGQIGSNYLFTLKFIDAIRYNVLNRESIRVTGDISKILDEIPSVVTKIVKEVKNISYYKETQISKDTISSKQIPYIEKIVWIKGGSFIMGSKSQDGKPDESPPHKVTIKSFYIDKYEVTKHEFDSVMGYNPSSSRGCMECPVENVSWYEADQYCKKLGKRLPTEAEWEYVCRAGTQTFFHYGNILSSEMANFDGRYPMGGIPAGQYKERTMPVGSYKPNPWGVYDMHGNVAEWCYDWYDPSYYGNSVETNPQGPKSGTLKVVRGGAYNQKGESLRCAKRAGYNPSIKLGSIGFRCVKDDTLITPVDTTK